MSWSSATFVILTNSTVTTINEQNETSLTFKGRILTLDEISNVKELTLDSSSA